MVSIGKITAQITVCVALAGLAHSPAHAQNDASNPYRTVEGWAKLPDGREWGATSAIYPANDGEHIWIAERCGANLCVGSDVDPVMLLLCSDRCCGLVIWPSANLIFAR